LGLLGKTQAAVPSDEEVGQKDADALARREEEHMHRSAELAGSYAARIAEAGTPEELRQLGSELTPEVKARLIAKDLERVRRLYGTRLASLKPAEVNGTG
jgi:hypothetical protein